MTTSFLREELFRIPVSLNHSWPHTFEPWNFVLPYEDRFRSLSDREKLLICNTRLQFHLCVAQWYGRWQKLDQLPTQRNFMRRPPIAAPELSLATSGSYITRTFYGAFVRKWDIVHILLTLIVCIIGFTLARILVDEDPPIFTGWRTIAFVPDDGDCLQLSTRTTRSLGYLQEIVFGFRRSSSFRLTVIYSRRVDDILVFKRRNVAKIRYSEITDLHGRFDKTKFDNWILKVVSDAMTIPYGSVWNLWHLTLT
ncbi:hypothetical protein CPB86DRAFT_876966 [Serendipita vermifera]|nr:hypothetical protein CPB86DRAFT_876966 [Serendipita vermifera]